VRFVAITSRKLSGGTVQKPRGAVMKSGLTVRIPMPALFTSRSMPSSRDHASPVARATESSSRTSSSRPTAPGIRPATSAARSCERPVSATRSPAPASAAAIARPRPLVPPVTNADRQAPPGNSVLAVIPRH
jgi:hypothetical protein